MLFSNAALTKLWIACVDRVLLVRERAPTPAPRRPWQMRWNRRGPGRGEREMGCLGGPTTAELPGGGRPPHRRPLGGRGRREGPGGRRRGGRGRWIVWVPPPRRAGRARAAPCANRAR